MRYVRQTLTSITAATLCVACSSAPTAPTDRPQPIAATAPHRKAFAPTPVDQLGTLPADLGLAVGTPAPDAEVHDIQGHAVHLAEIYRGGDTLLVFYRGGWCPYCNFQIRELASATQQFRDLGVRVVAISVDQPNAAARTQAMQEVPFPLLSDPDLVAHRAFRVVHHADDAEVKRLRGFGLDIEASSGRVHHDFAVPAIFLVRSGAIAWAHADPDYKTRPSVQQLLEVIRSRAPAGRAVDGHAVDGHGG
jgi:peroxiredoxin